MRDGEGYAVNDTSVGWRRTGVDGEEGCRRLDKTGERLEAREVEVDKRYGRGVTKNRRNMGWET